MRIAFTGEQTTSHALGWAMITIVEIRDITMLSVFLALVGFGMFLKRRRDRLGDNETIVEMEFPDGRAMAELQFEDFLRTIETLDVILPEDIEKLLVRCRHIDQAFFETHRRYPKNGKGVRLEDLLECRLFGSVLEVRTEDHEPS